MADSTRQLRALAFLALAVTSGSLALAGLHHLIGGYQEKIAEARKGEDRVMVIVAARDLYQGIPVTENDLYAVEIPPRFLPEGVFLSPDHVVGRIPRERILSNELVRSGRLSDPEAGEGLNAIIPRGLRALSVDLGDGAALEGFLTPGSVVDVLVTIQPDGDDGDAKVRTETIQQAVFVLGVDSRMGREDAADAERRRGRHRSSVTLLLTSDQAESVAHAANLGDLHLTLRNPGDGEEANLPGVDVAALRRKVTTVVVPPPVRTPVAAPSDCTVMVVVNGGERRELRAHPDGTLCD